jgi:hypothetical protein
MTNDKDCDIHHIIHPIINIKKYNYSYNEKKRILNNKSWLLNKTISKKKNWIKKF